MTRGCSTWEDNCVEVEDMNSKMQWNTLTFHVLPAKLLHKSGFTEEEKVGSHAATSQLVEPIAAKGKSLNLSWQTALMCYYF